MVNTPRRPLPGRIWGMLAAMVLVALLCLMLALLLGTRLRNMGPERGGGREGYMQVAKPVDGAKGPDVERENAQLEALMDQPSGGISTSVPDVSESVPVEMPVIPTEVPPETLPAAHQVTMTTPVEVSPLEVKAMPEAPLWKRNAVTVNVVPGAPQLAIIIDDMGGEMALSQRAVNELPQGVTLSFFPWSKPGVTLAKQARDEGHEIMIHMPMEALPHGDTVLDPGPDTLRVGMPTDEIEMRLKRNVANLSDVAVGLNNHMGSRFTEWAPGLRAVLTVLQGEGMLFVDSKTAAPTATKEAQVGLTLPILSRDVFLDHVPTPEAVRAELNKAVLLARKRGSAIAIGHPLPVTLDVLRAELPQVVSSGVVLVPVSMLVKE